MAVDVAEIPADIQAALDAYLAARIDDATWEAYVNHLGPGLALDVATTLCADTQMDAQAAGWLRWLVLGDPEAADPEDRKPLGIPACSHSLDTLIGITLDDCRVTMHLEYERREREAPSDAGGPIWIARLVGDAWESGDGRAAWAELERWREAEAELAGPMVAGWAVALCRAVCFSWNPEWARAQSQPDAH